MIRRGDDECYQRDAGKLLRHFDCAENVAGSVAVYARMKS